MVKCGQPESRRKSRTTEQLEADGYGSLNPAKVKKLLITAHAYSTPTTERIGKLYLDGRTVEDIMSLLNLSKAAVNNNLPYEKVVYKMDESGGDVSLMPTKSGSIRSGRKPWRSCRGMLMEKICGTASSLLRITLSKQSPACPSPTLLS